MATNITKVEFDGNTLIDLTGDTAVASDVLSGKTAHNSTGAQVEGTMTNNGAVTEELTGQGEEYTIPAGYHNGEGKITVNVDAGTITPNVTGGTSSGTIDAGKQIKIGSGYYENDSYYQASSPDPLSGNATADKVLDGSTFYSDSYTKKTGTMTNRSGWTAILSTQGAEYDIPDGYHSGSKVTVEIDAGTEGTPIATKGTASNYTLPVTPSVTNTEGYIESRTITGTAITISPSDLSLTKKTALTKSGGTVSLPAGSYNTSALSATVTADDLGLTQRTALTKSGGTVSIVANSYNTSALSQTVSAGDLGLTQQTSLSSSGATVSIPANSYNTSTLTKTVTATDLGLSLADSSSMTVSGATVSFPANYYTNSTISKSVSTVSRASTTISSSADSTNAKITHTASNNQGTGYVTGSNETATKTVSLSVSGGTVTASDGSASVSKSVGTGALSASGYVSVSGSGSVNPGTNSITENSNTNVSTGTVTTTKPSSGYYVAVDATTASNGGSVRVSGTGTATASVSTAGYVSTSTTGTGSVSGSGVADVTVPAKSASTTYVPITSGTTGTPTATIGTPSNYSVSVTPSVTNTEGYITGGAKTGTAVTVNPTHLGLSHADVDALEPVISNKIATVFLANGKYVDESQCNGSGITAVITASDLCSGSTTITSNGTHNVTGYENAVVNVPEASSYWVVIENSTSYSIAVELPVFDETFILHTESTWWSACNHNAVPLDSILSDFMIQVVNVDECADIITQYQITSNTVTITISEEC